MSRSADLYLFSHRLIDHHSLHHAEERIERAGDESERGALRIAAAAAGAVEAACQNRSHGSRG
jgi:hypothetical protein